jgi:1-acyl-sn-glycerol-3-phosphate acyltransferase
VLSEGDLLGIFPEGSITKDGQLQAFKGGITKILERAKSEGLQTDGMDVPTVPMALTNLWGSFFSRLGGAAMTQPFRRGLWSRVGLTVGESVRDTQATPEALRERVENLLAKDPR